MGSVRIQAAGRDLYCEGGEGGGEVTASYYADQTEPVLLRMTIEEYRELHAEAEFLCRHTLPAMTKLCKAFMSVKGVISE